MARRSRGRRALGRALGAALNCMHGYRADLESRRQRPRHTAAACGRVRPVVAGVSESHAGEARRQSVEELLGAARADLTGTVPMDTMVEAQREGREGRVGE